MSAGILIDAMIVGAEKAGTTSLLDYLGQHPSIAIPGKYSGRRVNIETGAEFDVFLREKLGVEQTRTLISNEFGTLPGNIKTVMAKSVSMLYDRQAIDRLKFHNPGAKVIVGVRSPVDRALSSFNYQRYRGAEKLLDFSAAVERELSGADLSIHLKYLLKSSYMGHVAYLDEVFGSDNVLIFVFELMRDDQRMCYERICRFVGVDTDFLPDFEHRNRAKVARSQRLAQFLSTDSFSKRFVRRITGRELRHKIFLTIRSLNSMRLQPDPVPAEIRSTLEDYFESDIKLLSGRTGIDLRELWFD